MNSPLNDVGNSTRKPGWVFKQKDITDTIINNTEAQATICSPSNNRHLHLFVGHFHHSDSALKGEKREEKNANFSISFVKCLND